MKRMSEVFILPINHQDIELCGLVEKQGITCAEAHAAHAINHVDALADALAAIVADYNRYTAINEVDMTDDDNARLHNLMVDAALALGCYRGDK